MADTRTTYYASAFDVSEIYKPGTVQTAIALAAESGASQVAGQRNRIYLALAQLQAFTPGDYVLVYDSDHPRGELVQVQSILEAGATTSYLELTADLTGTYTMAKTPKVELMGCFLSIRTGRIAGGTLTARTKPPTETVNRWINEAEQYIERRTRTAWRARSVANESHDFPARKIMPLDYVDGLPVKLKFRPIIATNASDGSLSKVLDHSAGDKLEIYGGGRYSDWLVDKTPSRKTQSWVDEHTGILMLRGFYKINSRLAVRVSYRYGDTLNTLPADIRRATALLACAKLLEVEHYIAKLPAGGELDTVPIRDLVQNFKVEAEMIIANYVGAQILE
jgi:hypothetical protein